MIESSPHRERIGVVVEANDGGIESCVADEDDFCAIGRVGEGIEEEINGRTRKEEEEEETEVK